MRVSRAARCVERAAQPGLGARVLPRLRERAAHGIERRRGRRVLGARTLVDGRPVALVERKVGDDDADERPRGRVRRGRLGRCQVGLVLVRPRERERVGAEERRVPAEEAPEDKRAPVLLLLERRHEPRPCEPEMVDPGREAPVALREMAELVRDDAPELLLVEGLHEREADDEVVPVPAERPEARQLHDRGVELPVQQELVHLRSRYLLAKLVDHAPERLHVVPAQPDALRRRDLHPERAQDDDHERAEREHELEDGEGRRRRQPDDYRRARHQ